MNMTQNKLKKKKLQQTISEHCKTYQFPDTHPIHMPDVRVRIVRQKFQFHQ